MAATFKPTLDPLGRALFFHYGPDSIQSTISPRYHGANSYTTDTRSRGVSYYYTKYGEVERVIRGKLYVIALDVGDVYYFNEDVNGYYTDAKRNFLKNAPGKSFGPVEQMEYVTDLAVKDGYKMIVARWENSFRAESPLPLKVDKKLTEHYRTYGVADPTDQMTVADIKNKAENIIVAVANTSVGNDTGITDLVFSRKNPFSDTGFKKLMADPQIIKILSKKLKRDQMQVLIKKYKL